jgi:AcrR family transcriptional regulator
MSSQPSIAGLSLERLLEVPAAGSAEGDVRERIVAAALAAVEDFGIRRFTVDEVARRSGVSRVTVYRHFPRKDRLLEAVLMYELQRVLVSIEDVVSRYGTIEARLVEGFAFGLTAIRDHQLLQRLMRTEPELVLPALTVDAAPLLAMSRDFIPHLARTRIGPGQEGGLQLGDDALALFGELLGRAALSFLLTPESVLGLDGTDQIRDFSRAFLAPLLALVAGGEERSAMTDPEV